MNEQRSGQEIDVANWTPDEDFGVYPEGARDKNLYRSPSLSPFPFLLPNHRYLFKRSIERAPEQFWMEIVAYEIANFGNVNVPPAFAAYNSKTGQSGALIQWFYRADEPIRFISGGEYMQQLIPDYGRRKGRLHNFQTIIELGHIFTNSKQMTFSFSTWLMEWSKVIVFDALIGNTDRHQDNWGVLWEGEGDLTNLTSKLSPAFDNGTSLGWEILDRNIFKFDDDNYLEKYLSNGRHHLRWNRDDLKSMPHVDLVKKIALDFSFTKKSMQACLEFDSSRLKEVFQRISSMKIPIALSASRQSFLLRLISARQEKLFAILKLESHESD